jgi:amino acid adenylation domain-containing protein
MGIGWLAILKAGAACVPVEPQQPRERLRHLFDDCGAAVLLTHSRVASALPADALCVRCLDDAAAFDGAATRDPVVAGLTPHQPAYVIYTSGSTGAAKGVVVAHRSAVHFWQVMRDSTHRELAPASRVALNASFAFDMSLKGWLQLLSGHAVHLVPTAVRADGPAMLDFLKANAIDAFDSTPSQLELLVDAGLLELAAGEAPRVVVLGGEPIAPAAWNRLRRAPHVRFFNMYGPTECTVDATLGRIEPDDERPHIGRPIANARVYLLDEAHEPVPVGLPGEIHIAGVGVAIGYLGRPELTAQRFLPDPFVAGERMYRTGDLGRWRADGRIEYIGRNDFQVKLRGYRIELGEIESALRAHPLVAEAQVLLRTDPAGLARLVAYVVPRPGASLDLAPLRDHLAASLPEYMVPGAFLVMERFPLNANGKLDRGALPEPDDDAFVRGRYEAPQGETELALAALWQELLGVERVGRNDDFFDLGGHSLLAVQLISRVREVLGVEVDLTDLFADSRLAHLATVVESAHAAASTAILPVDRERPLPLSLAQQRLWFLDALDAAAGAAYRYDIAIRIVGTLDLDALRRTLDALVRRHEGLRTTFARVDGLPVQRIGHADAGLPLRMHDLRALSPDAREAALAALRREEAGQAFDLAAGPLLRARLCGLADDEAVLLLTLHHIVTDHWSNQRLVQEINALYRAFRRGEADPLPPLAVQYADYAAWQRERLQGPALAAQVAYWREHLAGAPALLELPADRARPSVQRFAGGNVAFTLPADRSRALRQLGQRHGCTLFMTLLAGWAAFLSRLSGQADLVVGTPVANRPTREVEDLIGFFVNTLAIRVRIEPGCTVGDLLAGVKAHTVAGFGHQELPFEQVVEAVNPPRSLACSPIFQTMFTLHQGVASDSFEMPGTRWSLLDSVQGVSHFDLSLSFTETMQGELAGVIDYASDLFDEATVRRWARHFETLLGSMVADETQAVARLALLEAGDVRLLTQDFSAYVSDAPLAQTVHALFEAQVARTPDAVAVVEGEVRVSYAALNRRANQLAHALLGRGLAPEERVAVGCERGVDLLVALLGVLKAGGAYLPLDPALPRERQAFMVADSGARTLVASSHLLARLPETPFVLRLDEPAWAEGQPEHNPGGAMDSQRLAYVIYTSGSTGEPKGVMVSHRNVVHLTVNQDFIDFSPRHTFAYCANPAFDASTWEIWGSLLNGVRMVIVPADVLLEPEALAALLQRERVTILQLIAGLLKRYAESLAGAISQLEVLLFGGDQSELHTVLQIWRATRPCRLIHAYGPTETTTFTTEYVVDEATQAERTLPIGRPIANSRIYVLDAHGQPVPLGVQGEIHIGGEGVTRGYLNRDALTAERFVADPFARAAGVAGARMYRTGDLGRYREDGNLEFLGRDDHQVKLRGYRIELGEIELRLAQCAGVRQAFVMARTDAGGEKRLVAYLTGEPADAATLRAELARHLPEYMVPAAYVTLASLPVTDNGKVDRRALPEPDATASATRAYVAPQGDVECALAEIWQALLNVPAVGRDDHFFELGGHSLIAVQFIARIREQFEVDLPLKELFAQPVLWRLADAITTLRLALYADHDLQALERELATLSQSDLLALLNGANDD